MVPVVPHFKHYRGGKENIRQKTEQFNAMAQRVADHLNTLIANNPDEIQQYLFYSIARDLHLTVDDVRSAISDGGYNGITVGVREEYRRDLVRYKKP
jgi:hypothetical protein